MSPGKAAGGFNVCFVRIWHFLKSFNDIRISFIPQNFTTCILLNHSWFFMLKSISITLRLNYSDLLCCRRRIKKLRSHFIVYFETPKVKYVMICKICFMSSLWKERESSGYRPHLICMKAWAKSNDRFFHLNSQKDVYW